MIRPIRVDHNNFFKWLLKIIHSKAPTSSCVFTLWVGRKRSVIWLFWSTTQSWTFLVPEWEVQVQRWSPSRSIWNFLQLHWAENGISARNGIWPPTEVSKKVCQRLADQVSSLRWDLILPSELIDLKYKTRIGSSSSCDSKWIWKGCWNFRINTLCDDCRVIIKSVIHTLEVNNIGGTTSWCSVYCVEKSDTVT